MKPTYSDITSRLGPPLWWDKNGVPRYEEFHPKHASCIYASQVVLMEVGCQNCDKLMLVEKNNGFGIGDDFTFAIRDNQLHYGDPPEHDDHCGETMNSVPKRIVQFWNRNARSDWQRVTELEITFPEKD